MPDAPKGRHPGIPWPRIVAIQNRLRHEYDQALPDVLWKVGREDLLALEYTCQIELTLEQDRERARDRLEDEAALHQGRGQKPSPGKPEHD